MPIYAYRCEACGFAKDVLQKVSDPQLTDCLSCGKSTFKKQLTAAGFQLKGTGWYATDFRGGAGTTVPPVSGTETPAPAPANGAAGSATTDKAVTPATATPASTSTTSGASGSSGSGTASAS